MMTKILVYVYTQKIYAGREIARQLEENMSLPPVVKRLSKTRLSHDQPFPV